MTKRKDEYATSRFLYILEATFEYFIALLCGGAYIAKLSTSLGVSDSLTGILTAIVSLGGTFQIVAIFLSQKRRVKRLVTLLHTLNQLAFTLVYLTPFFPLSATGKIVLFVIFLLLGHIVNSIVNSPKQTWYMSLVDDEKRGDFTATKEIVSLIGGMTFTFIIGLVIDNFEEAGNLNGAFIFCGIAIFVLTLLHTSTLLFSKEKPVLDNKKTPLSQSVKGIFKNKNLWKIIVIMCLWEISLYGIISFFGTYQIKELGFSMTFVSILSIIYSIVRALASKPLGRFADRRSFRTMLTVCYLIHAVGFLFAVFTVPSNGKIFFTIYYALHAIAMGGANSATINLVYDYVGKEERMGAFALSKSVAGLVGFLSTLGFSRLVEYIQNNGNTFLGIPVYAQQVLSVIGIIVLTLAIVYLNTAVKKMKKPSVNGFDTLSE
jgi:predicted MFS family arabinose efflux permease